MGIISGFLGGAGRGAAQAGQMLLADKLAKEREEARALRDSALRKDLQASRQTFQSGLQTERIAADADRTEATIASADARSAATIASSESEGEADRKSREKIAANKPPKNAQTISIDGGNGLVVDAILNKDGTYTVPIESGSSKSRTVEVTTADMEKAVADYNSKASALKSDNSQFGMSEKKYKEKRALEFAMERLSKGTAPKTDTDPITEPTVDTDATAPPTAAGIVGSQSDTGDSKPKSINGLPMSYEQFKGAMRRKNPDASERDLKETWDSIK